MKIHEKDANSILTPSSSPINKRRRLSAKRKPSVEDEAEQAEEPPVKKVCFQLFFLSMYFSVINAVKTF